MDKAEILALRMGRMTKVGILALVDKGAITVPQAFNLMYQQGREDTLNELMDIRDDLPIEYDEAIRMLFSKYEQIKEQRV